jgi:hypothetical protein
LCSSSNIIRKDKSRRMRWAVHVAYIWEKRNVYRVLVWKPDGKRPLRKSRYRWEYNIKICSSEIGWGGITGFIWLRIGTSGGL